jgi:acyl dehydratase
MYLEDFKTGDEAEFGRYEVTREEILEFARKYDPQPFHVDDEMAKKTHFGGLVASGWHTCAITMRMIFEQIMDYGTSLGSPGVNKIRWLKPVRPGDILRVHTTVGEVRASKSRPEMGSVEIFHRILNQSDEVVMTMEAIALYLRRPQE